MKAIGKFFKFIFWTVIVLVLLAVVAVLTIPWWVGPTVTGVSNFVVPKIIKTDFRLDRFELNQYKGTFGMGQMKVANPEGFAPENCLELDALDVKFDPVSCFTKKVHIEKITLDGLRLIADFPQGANFQKIAENANGGKSKKEEKEEAEPKAEKEKEPVKVVIDVVEIKNLKLTYGAAPIVLPDFTITDIGKDEGGIDAESAWEDIYKKVCDKAGIVVGVVLDAGQAVIDAGGEALNAAVDSGKAAINNVAEAAGKADIGGMADAAKQGASNVAETVTEGISSAADAIGSGASAAGDMVGKGMDAVGSGIGAAVDIFKGGSK